ncbi:MAG TPA: TetR/AcrR family transcriptional regulator [Candidatus Limnocylindrales bacterium]|nr:TetR/AcrR family transcriptional regulator [Candidatus Limnocylindrales bacterium]
MAPRTYTLRDRATSASATHQRILEAARGLYQERGVAATTLKAIAERADVSRGTILHHFGDADGLVQAVAVDVLASLELPDEQILDGVEGHEARIRAFVGAIVRFYERSTPWWTVFESQMQRPELQALETQYNVTIGRLQAAALGQVVGDDRMANGTANALIHPATLGALIWTLQSSGFSLDEVIDVAGNLMVTVLERRPKPSGMM